MSYGTAYAALLAENVGLRAEVARLRAEIRWSWQTVEPCPPPPAPWPLPDPRLEEN